MNLHKIVLKEQDYSKALEIWENAVIATHDFLQEQDREALKQEIPMYLSHVEAYLWFAHEAVIGFSGTHEQNLEMLFIDPKYFNQGYGSVIIQTLIEEAKINHVDVNKDNHQAIKLYIKNGFKIYKESPKDGQGRDYPLLHLKL